MGMGVIMTEVHTKLNCRTFWKYIPLASRLQTVYQAKWWLCFFANIIKPTSGDHVPNLIIALTFQRHNYLPKLDQLYFNILQRAIPTIWISDEDLLVILTHFFSPVDEQALDTFKIKQADIRVIGMLFAIPITVKPLV